MTETAVDALDRQMMARCIALSRRAVAAGELPFAAVIARDGEIVAEAENRVARDRDVTRHAEIIAIADAQRRLGTRLLRDCTLYSTVEPCPMCAFPAREAQVGRVVFALRSPLMGGLTKWNVLRDSELSAVLPEAFGGIPEIVAGVLAEEAVRAWKDWNWLGWQVIRGRGCFDEPGAPRETAPAVERFAALRNRSFLRSLLALHR